MKRIHKKFISLFTAVAVLSSSFVIASAGDKNVEQKAKQKYISNFDSQCNSPDFPTAASIIEARNKYFGETVIGSEIDKVSGSVSVMSTPFAFSEQMSKSWHNQGHNESKLVGYMTEPSTGTNLAQISSRKTPVPLVNTYRCEFLTNVGANATRFYCGISSNGHADFTPDMKYPAQSATTSYISIGSGSTSYLAYLLMY